MAEAKPRSIRWARLQLWLAVAANVNVSLDNEFRQHDGVLPIFRRFPNSECSSTVAWAGVDSIHREVPQTNTCYHIKESSIGGVTKMIRTDYRNGPGCQGQPQLKGDGSGKAGHDHHISKDSRVRKQVEWQNMQAGLRWGRSQHSAGVGHMIMCRSSAETGCWHPDSASRHLQV